MSPNIPGNVAKHSAKCHQTFRKMLPNILGNVLKHSREYRQIFRRKSPNIPGNVAKYSGESHQIFRGMSPNIPGNTIKDSTAVLDAVLLNYLLFAVDFATAKKSTKIIVKCVVVKCYYTFCQVNH